LTIRAAALVFSDRGIFFNLSQWGPCSSRASISAFAERVAGLFLQLS
jgi:hypothetical protein